MVILKILKKKYWWGIYNYPVKHISPALHWNTLEHCEHGKAKIIKMGDAPVGSWPSSPAFCAVDGTATSISSLGTRRWHFILP